MTSTKIHAGSIVRRTADMPFSNVDDELLAIDEQAGCLYSLNESAGRLWELIGEPTAVSAVCVQLRQEFAVDQETCLREALQLLQGLHEAGLVQVED